MSALQDAAQQLDVASARLQETGDELAEERARHKLVAGRLEAEAYAHLAWRAERAGALGENPADLQRQVREQEATLGKIAALQPADDEKLRAALDAREAEVEELRAELQVREKD